MYMFTTSEEVNIYGLKINSKASCVLCLQSLWNTDIKL